MFASSIADGFIIRLFEERHASDLAAAVDQNRAYLREWLPWVDEHRGPADALDFIRRALEQFAENEGFHAGIWHGRQLVGAIGTHRIDWSSRLTSVGYWLGADFQGRGVMTAACRAVVDHLFGELMLNRVEVRCGLGNQRSCAIPERLGFRKEGVIRQGQWVNGRYVDLVVYGILREEWLNRQSCP